MRLLFVFAALATLSAPAAAQTSPPPDERLVVAENLAAIWRPLPAGAGEVRARFTAACEGAVEEMNAFAAALPEPITPEAVRGLRTTRGLVLAPGADPGQLFIFPGVTMRGIASGLGSFSIVDSAQGRLAVTDAAGTAIQVQLGRIEGTSVIRITLPDGAPETFVGCAPLWD